MELTCDCGGALVRESGSGNLTKSEKFVCAECGKEGWYVERADGKKLFIGCVG